MPCGFDDWETVYQKKESEALPWFIPDLDPDLDEELKTRSITSGLFLDIGTGPGTQALELANRGFTVVATDISETAVKKAQKISSAVEFVHDDIRKTSLDKKFDFIFDRGCFHAFPSELRSSYVQTIAKLLKPGGLFFLKCFSVKEKDHSEGPYKFSEESIRVLFGSDFSIERVKETEYQGTLDPFPKALFVVLRKL